MLHPLRKKIGDGLWNFICSLAISFSLAMLWSRTFLSEGHALSVLVRCAAFLAVFAVVDKLPGKLWKPLFYIVIALVGAGLAFFGMGPVHEMIQGCKAMFLQWALRPENPSGTAVFYAAYYTEDLRTLLCLVICVMVYAQVADDAFGLCVFMFAVFTALPYMLIQFANFPVLPFSAAEGVRMAAPGAAGLVMVLGSRGGRRAGLIPVAAILTAAAFLLAPAEGTMDQSLNRMAERASWYGRDLFFTGEDRSAFSLASTDYMPLKDRLGGGVRKSSDPVMLVTTDATENIYLKGTSCDTYTGFGWQDTLSDRGYLFNGPLNGANREKAFGKTQIMEEEPVTVNVLMLRSGPATVFSPQRILSFSGGNDRMVLYFNQTGELYITRDMEQGDGYTITCLTPDEEDARAYLSSVSTGKDNQWEQVCSEYLTVPDSVNPVVRDMTLDIIFGIPDPLDRAIAIRNYLRDKYPYSLQTGTPDPNEDFVSWFLLKEKKGYCTYFASAMTVMCRIAGIPARYVVGYAFKPSEDGTTTVTTGDGHAWTEIYLEGFGWLTMDATGSSGNGDSGKDGSRDKWEVTMVTPTPVPSSKRGTENENTVSSANDGQDQPTPTPTAKPTAAPSQSPNGAPNSPSPDETDGPAGGDNPPGNNPLLWTLIIILIILLAVICMIMIIYRMTTPAYKASCHPEKAATFYYDAAFQICLMKFGDINPSETWPEYAERIRQIVQSTYLADAAADHQDSFYKKDHQADPGLAKHFWQEMWTGCSLRMKIRITLKRFFK